jgi:hypothetical protein
VFCGISRQSGLSAMMLDTSWKLCRFPCRVDFVHLPLKRGHSTFPHSKRWWEKGSIRKVWRPGRVLEIRTWDSLLPLVCYESSVKVDGLQ